MDPVLSVIVVMMIGTAAVYAPVAIGSWVLRKGQLLEAWRSEPAQLPLRRRLQYSRLLFQEAVEVHQAGDHLRAAEICRRVLRFESDDPQSSRLLIASLFAAGEFNQAREALERHMVVHPNDEAAKLVPAAIFCEQGDLYAARQALDKIDPQKLAPADRALWYNNYAFTLSGLEVDLELAKEYGERALEIAARADRQFALRTLGIVEMARGAPLSAIGYFYAVLREQQYLRSGDVEFTKYHLARAHLALGQEQDARVYLEAISDGDTPYVERAKELLRGFAERQYREGALRKGSFAPLALQAPPPSSEGSKYGEHVTS